jgi:1-aminocyclopropane-1-carboxylate deaminase/D-cysteine desulfhydrase-like pyridoxal-dependent ACC family enzyme
LHDESLAAGVAVSFTFTNDRIAPSDVLLVAIASGATAAGYLVTTSEIGAGSAVISLRNLSSGTLSEAVILNFLLVKSNTLT